RSFPGRPDGTVTEKIADYLSRVLLPMADLVLDFNSGGKTLDFLPFCAAHILPNKKQQEKAFEFMTAFAAPYSMKMLEID
ncbi:succinylglutamate desuccinylase/aspartoacylase family protein, partial [Rhizobium johnstonii]